MLAATQAELEALKAEAAKSRRAKGPPLPIRDVSTVSAIFCTDAKFFELIQNQQDISAIKDKLLFGKAFCEELLAG